MSSRLSTLLLFGAALGLAQVPGRGPGGSAPTPRAIAVFDPTGYWVSIVDEDWRWRMLTPPKGDFASVPLNAEGKRVGNAWDPRKDDADGNACKAHGAAGLMRLPVRLHITWADDQTLKIEADAGQQTRLIHFDGSKWKGGTPDWQGDSVGSWHKQAQSRGFAPPMGGPRAGGGGTLQVITSHMRPGYLRRNGVPYSGSAVLTEFVDRFEEDGLPYLILTTVVDDPTYLNDRFITSEQFLREPDGAKWNPTPCKTE